MAAKDPRDVLEEAQKLAKAGNCFIVTKTDSDGPRYIVYRRAEPKNVCVGTRRNIHGLLRLIKRATTCETAVPA